MEGGDPLPPFTQPSYHVNNALLVLITAIQVCPPCTVEFAPSDTLGSLDDPASVGPLAEVFRFEDGRILISSETWGSMVLTYDANGHYSGTLGRDGQGPGEFSTAVRFVPSQRGVAVHELRTPRVHEFSADLAFLDSFWLPGVGWSLAQKSDGEWLSVASRVRGDSVEVVHVLSEDGEVQSSFYHVPADGGLAELVHRVAVDDKSHVWLTSLNGVVRVFSESGVLIADHLLPSQDLGKPLPLQLAPDQRPPGQIMGVETHGDGTIWVFSAEPDADWKKPRLGGLFGVPSPEEIHDTILYVLRLTDGGVEEVATQRFDTLLRGLGNGWAYDLVDTPDGDRRVRIGSLTLKPSSLSSG